MPTHRNRAAAEDASPTHSVSTIRAEGTTTAHLPRNLVVITDWGDIDLLADPTKNILLYPWAPSITLQEMIARKPFAELPQSSFTLAKDRLAGAAPIVEDELVRHLLTELAPALSAFASIAPGDKLHLSLCKTRQQSCPLFHIDRFAVRLLCTLRGPGTEWLDDAQVNRKGLGRGDNRKVTGPDATVYAAQPFQILILKGDVGSGTTSHGVVHRSPAVPLSADGRWYLRVDPILTSRSAIYEWSRL